MSHSCNKGPCLSFRHRAYWHGPDDSHNVERGAQWVGSERYIPSE